MLSDALTKAGRSGAPTRAEKVYAELRGDILNGRLDPGERLPFAQLGERYRVSTGVLREVLPRLVEQGLVTSERQFGFRVMTVSEDDLRHLTEVRITIESQALRQSVEQGDLAWQSRLVAIHHTLAATPTADPSGAINEDWLRAHAEFHATLNEACPNARLRGLADSLRAVSEVYRCWSCAATDSAGRDVAGEHRRILDAALASDADRAVAELTAHIQRTTDALLASRGATAPDEEHGR
ncbi:GntR family transcriptional regulator [Streptomyces sp. Y7]|uniref:GntR family transcriptional regulator n=1 Tax=Streptomyces sp. Y7 TaxID=3342392 RepID=UPI00371D4C41